MEYFTQEELKQINKWYFNPYFALFLGMWWPFYGVTLVIAIVLQFLRQRKISKLIKLYQPIINHENSVYDIIDVDNKLKSKQKEYIKLEQEFQIKNENLEKNYVLNSSKLEQEYKDKLNELNINHDKKINELDTLYKNKESKLSINLANNIKSLKIEIEDLGNQKQDLLEELDSLNSEIIKTSFDFTNFDEITSGEFKNQLTLSRLDEEKKLKEGKLISISSIISDKKFITNNSKQITRLFNAECDSIMSKASVKNIDSSINKITRSFNSLNKIFETDGMQLNRCWLEIKLDQLNTMYLYEMKKSQEKEIQRAIKEQMLEEEKVRREIERQKKELEKDEKQFNNEITRTMKYLQKSSNDVEKEMYIEKIKELREELKKIKVEKEDVLKREVNAKAGFVYIISNIGSFGKDVYKIGMTRRLEPMDRIKELSSASVPFEFDVHAMIFSDNAPELENILHQTFRDKSVNKVNYRKEFFKVTLDEIENVVKQNYDKTVEFIKIPNASEYRQTLEIENNK